MMERTKVYEMLTKEDRYAQGWSSEAPRPDGSVKRDHMCSATTGQPFSDMEWIIFAEKYLDEAKLAYANYTPDMRAIRIRILKAASLLVSALQSNGVESDLDSIAGISSTKFPIKHGGLKALQDEIEITRINS
jgi:hypothetical protein